MSWKPLSRDYSPGGLSTQAARRAAGRRGGRESGRKRRQLSPARRGNAGPGQTTASLCYELRQLSRREFDQRYELAFPRPERPCAEASWERGREVVWTHLVASWRLLAARGQHCRTTNWQRGQALSSQGLPRCRRSVQLYHRKLEAMGIAKFSHLRRPPGKKDCLVMEWRISRRLQSSFSPPTAKAADRGSCPTGIASPPIRQQPNSLIPPASRADDEPPDELAERPATESERIAAEIRFVQLKLDLGWGERRELRRRIDRLRAQARGAHASSGGPERGSDG